MPFSLGISRRAVPLPKYDKTKGLLLYARPLGTDFKAENVWRSGRNVPQSVISPEAQDEIGEQRILAHGVIN